LLRSRKDSKYSSVNGGSSFKSNFRKSDFSLIAVLSARLPEAGEDDGATSFGFLSSSTGDLLSSAIVKVSKYKPFTDHERRYGAKTLEKDPWRDIYMLRDTRIVKKNKSGDASQASTPCRKEMPVS
jgi:hypothetical protein